MNKEVKKSLINFALALLSPISVSLFWRNWQVLTAILILIGILMLAIEKDRSSILLYIVASIGGAVTEIVAILFGAWVYTEPHIAGIPIWLPFLWGAAALYIVRLKIFIDAIFKK